MTPIHVNRLIAGLCMMLVPVFAFAQHNASEREWDDRSDEEILIYNDAIAAFLDTNAAQSVSDLTVGELRGLGERLSVIAQQENYVQRARQASRMFPGAGHFMIDEPGTGAAFGVGSVVVAAGTIVGAYFLLPDDIRFDELDYINDSFKEISQAWRGESIASLAPAAGVLLGGIIVNGILGELASDDVERRARAQIASGAVSFDPQPFIYPDAEGRLVLGARIGF